MKLNRSIALAFNNLRKAKGKTTLSAIGVAIGASLLIILMSVGFGLNTKLNDEIMSSFASLEFITVLPFDLDIGLGTDVVDETGMKFNQGDIDTIQNAIGNEHVIYSDIMLFANKVNSRKKIALSGGSDAYYANEFITQDGLEFEGKAELLENEISISDKTAELLDAHVGDTIDLIISFPQQTATSVYTEDAPSMQYSSGEEIAITIANIYTTNEDVNNIMQTNFISSTTSRKILENYNNVADRYHQLIVKVSDIEKIEKVSSQIDDLGYYNFNFKKIVKGFNESFKAITYGAMAIGLVALLISMFGIANTMVMTVMERTREIGLLKALGMSDNMIKIVFICEVGLIGFLGSILGIVCSVIFCIIGNQLLMSFGGEEFGFALFDFKIWLLCCVFIFALFVSIIAGLIPASRAAKIDPIKALRTY